MDGAGASHEVITHLPSLSSPRRTVLFTSGWMITGADEQAIGPPPAAARQAAVDQDESKEDKHVAEVTDLLRGRPPGRRAAVDRAPDQAVRRQARNLTAFEAPRLAVLHYLHQYPRHRRIGGVPAATTPSSSTCCTASTPSSKTGADDKSMACAFFRRRPGPEMRWARAANSPPTWPPGRLLGPYTHGPQRRRAGHAALPAERPAGGPPRPRPRPENQRTWPWKEASLACWHRLCALPAPA